MTPSILHCLSPWAASPLSEKQLATFNLGAVFFVCSHPLLVIGLANADGWDVRPAIWLSLLTAFAAILGNWCLRSKPANAMLQSVLLILMCGLMMFFGGPGVRSEVQTYVCICLVVSSVFANPAVVLSAGLFASVQHVIFLFYFPVGESRDVPAFAAQWFLLALSTGMGIVLARMFSENVARLKQQIVDGTQALGRSHRELQTILNSVQQGFFKIDSQGIVVGKQSSAVGEMLGKLRSGDSLVDFLAQVDPRVANWLSLGLVQVFSQVLPLSITLAQLPKKLLIRGRCLALSFHPVSGEVLTHLIVVVSDVTAEEDRLKLEQESAELLAMFQQLATDRTGFLEFMDESNEIIASLRRSTDDIAFVKRQVHTLKGNARLFGLARLAEACHSLEELIGEEGDVPDGRPWTRLLGCWSSTRGNLRKLTEENTNTFLLSNDQYHELLLGILDGESTQDLACKVARWNLSPLEPRLQRLGEQARRLAIDLGKGEIEVLCQDHGLRIESGVWQPFWQSLVHVVRNAVDHGLETIEERRLAKKSDVGRIEVITQCVDESFEIIIRDDGRGIDWDRVAERAANRGLPHVSQGDLIDALFHDGVSTCETCTEISGRGVGMAAVQCACHDLGGVVQVQSSAGKGTEFRFVFPTQLMAPDTHMLLTVHGIEPHFHTVVAV